MVKIPEVAFGDSELQDLYKKYAAKVRINRRKSGLVVVTADVEKLENTSSPCRTCDQCEGGVVYGSYKTDHTFLDKGVRVLVRGNQLPTVPGCFLNKTLEQLANSSEAEIKSLEQVDQNRCILKNPPLSQEIKERLDLANGTVRFVALSLYNRNISMRPPTLESVRRALVSSSI